MSSEHREPSTPNQRFWVSWHQDTSRSFELHSPWWMQGNSDDGKVIFAAIEAPGEIQARATVFAAQDVPHEIAFSFVKQKPDDWSPFTDEFPRADWMQWPSGDD